MANKLNGVDIASFQKNFDAAKMTTTDFVIVKMTQGTWYINPFAEAQYNSARAAGKLLGAYHYAEGTDPVKEADFFLWKVGGRIGECILALDWEGKDNKAFSSAAGVEWCKKFLNRIREKTGVLPLIYMSKSVTYRYNWEAVAKTYPLWCACYGSNSRTGYKAEPWTDKNSFGKWPGDIIRQYSSKGDIKGYSGNIDLDAAYMSKAEWAALAGSIAPDRAYNRSVIVNLAMSHAGEREGSAAHRAIIDAYNAHAPLARGYKVKYSDAWCATFISYLAIATGYTDIIPTECGCPQMVELAKQMGIWVEDDAYRPAPGDIVLYDFQDSGRGDNTGVPDHIGIVALVEGNNLDIVEGNYKDAVGIRKIAVNGKYIRGYIVPRYTGDEVITDDIHMVRWKAITKAATKARMRPDVNAARCSFSPIPQGAEVGVCKRDGKFYLVKYGAKFGYVHRASIKKKTQLD